MNNKLAEFIEQLTQCRTVEASWDLFLNTMADCGISHAAYAMSAKQTSNDSSPIGKMEDIIALFDYPEGFVDDYFSLGMSDHDPCLQIAQHVGDIFLWEDPELWEKYSTPQSLEVDRVGYSYDVQYGFSLPIQVYRSNNIGNIGLSATGIKEREFDKDIAPYKDYIRQLGTLFHMHIQSFPLCNIAELTPLRTPQATLTAMEKETLKWLTRGHSIHQIADEKLHRSTESINKYIANAKQKLSASNRDQLIARAVFLGIVEL